MKKRPVTTLFMLSSVDGKISTGNSDLLDVDSDYPAMDGVKEGLHQYYEIEQTTDLWSLNSGLVQAKLGVNQKEYPDKSRRKLFLQTGEDVCACHHEYAASGVFCTGR